MQRPGFDDKRLMAADDDDEMFWKSLMPPRKRKKVLKKAKKKKKFSDANLNKKSRKTDKGKREKKKKKNLSPTLPGPSHMTEETKTKKKTKKKKVAFDLSPSYIFTRHPEVVVSPSVRERVAPADPDSQVDDINSQDLFITQKTFRVSPSDTFSEEVKTPPKPRILRDKIRTKEQVQRTSKATQTENFFTSQMSRFLHFQRSLSVVTDVQPLDLSLPHRRRSAKGQSRTSRRDARVGKQVGSKSDEDSVTSNESQPEAKSVTASSDDSESTGQVGRADVSQVRAVQTRLDKSFFFKTKGESQPPRPESPLMKLSQGRDKKSRKKIKTN